MNFNSTSQRLLGHEEPDFLKMEHSTSKNKYSEDDIKMLEFLVDNIFVDFAENVFQQTVVIQMCTNCAHLLVFIRSGIHKVFTLNGEEASSRFNLSYRYNLTYSYIDDLLSINNTEFGNYLGHMYPIELEIKDITESITSAEMYFILIKSDLKWCIHLSRSLYLYFNYLVSATAGGPRSPRGHM